MTVDTLIAMSIVIGAALYLYRKFAKNSKRSGSGCSSSGGCCGSHNHKDSSHSCTTNH
ncbi:MAG: FeoB-associated Cys-rich membrane protein [Deltaproteobacteria bacterium]|jgi:hypothetical protein|nr:FeoB-associated Cys-rich membrane protein [Deltaproteobacteria bacterium]MBW2477469.1 FeoB-associated Cys-rich membrane protein [Deltaproteobacteria bacterium]